MTWKPVKGYEGLYEVSDTGLVKSVDRYVCDNKCCRLFKGVMLHPWKHNGKEPYNCVSLRKDGAKKHYLVHRLVAEAFISNTNNLPQVNHIDGDVHNNNVTNLEWCTNQENTIHAYNNQLRKKKVIYLEYDNKIYTFRALCQLIGVEYKKTLYKYHKLNWSLFKCFKGGDVHHVKY